jgi:hypothetical protein
MLALSELISCKGAQLQWKFLTGEKESKGKDTVRMTLKFIWKTEQMI